MELVMPVKIHYVTDAVKKLILHDFYTLHNNSTTALARKYKIPVNVVSNLIEKDLSTKANYYED